MAGVGHVPNGGSWGPAERAAMDRCLTRPAASDPPRVGAPIGRLARTIEAEIIPRLMLAHRADDGRSGKPLPLGPGDVADFANLALSGDVASARLHIEGLRDRGHPLDTLFLGLLAPAARLLGHMWEEDLCTFSDVTLGLSRLQQVLRALSPGFEGEPAGTPGGRVLLAPVPGEQHSFGLSMLESFFRRGGLDVRGGAACSEQELIDAVSQASFDMVGLSLSSDVLLDNVRPAIEAIRRSSRNKALLIMVGGRYFAEHPDCAARVGADAVAADAPEALLQVQAYLGVGLSRS